MKRRYPSLLAVLLLFLSACSSDNDFIRRPDLEPQFGTAFDDMPVGVATGQGSAVFNLYNYVNLPEECDSWYCLNYREIAVLERYNASGTLLWQRNVIDIPCTYRYCDTYRAEALFVDANNYTYVLVSDYYANEPDGDGPTIGYFVKRYGPSGEEAGVIYLYYFYYADRDEASLEMAVDRLGNIYVVAQSSRYASAENYVTKYSSTGYPIWQRLSTVPQAYGTPFDITVTAAGNIYIVGSKGLARYSNSGNLVWTKTGTLYSGSDLSTLVASGSNLYVSVPKTGAVRKYDANGKLLWSRVQSGLNTLVIGDISSDTNGNLFISGKYRPTSRSPANAFVRKLKPTGAILWTKTFGTPQYDDGRGIATINGSEIYITGETQGSLAHTNIGGSDGYLRKLNSLGNQVWIR